MCSYRFIAFFSTSSGEFLRFSVAFWPSLLRACPSNTAQIGTRKRATSNPMRPMHFSPLLRPSQPNSARGAISAASKRCLRHAEPRKSLPGGWEAKEKDASNLRACPEGATNQKRPLSIQRSPPAAWKARSPHVTHASKITSLLPEPEVAMCQDIRQGRQRDIQPHFHRFPKIFLKIHALSEIFICFVTLRDGSPSELLNRSL